MEKITFCEYGPRFLSFSGAICQPRTLTSPYISTPTSKTLPKKGPRVCAVENVSETEFFVKLAFFKFNCFLQNQFKLRNLETYSIMQTKLQFQLNIFVSNQSK